jgi:hypothetical protein
VPFGKTIHDAETFYAVVEGQDVENIWTIEVHLDTMQFLLLDHFEYQVTDIPSKKEIYNAYINLRKILKHARIFHCFELPYMTCTFDKSTEFMDHCMNKYFVQSAIYNNNPCHVR